MSSVTKAKLSAKGQLAIPAEVRERYNLTQGTEFVIVSDKDTLVLKRLQKPSAKRMASQLSAARKGARKAGMKHQDVAEAVKAVRRK